MKPSLRCLPVLVVVLFAMAVPAMAQDGGERGQDRGADREGARDRGDRGDRGNWRERWENMSDEEREAMRKQIEARRAEMEERRSEALRERLGISKEDFEAVTPLIEKVRGAVREHEAIGRMSQRGDVGGRGLRAPAEQSAHAKAAGEAMQRLREAIEDDNTSDIKSALTKLRTARAGMDKTLKDAREELRSVCTPKWEAEFVMMGLLD